MNILFISPEVFPFAKTGGLADVAGSLPEAVAKKGHKASTILPYYQLVRKNGFKPVVFKKNIPLRINNREESFNLLLLKHNGVDVYFIEKNEYYDREFLYGTPQGDYQDNAFRFGFYAKAILASIPYIGRQDVFHCNDWQSGLVPLYIKAHHKDDPLFSNVKILFTIHNMAYQGLFVKDVVPYLDISWDLFNQDGVEFWDKLSFMKAGMVFSDAISTVSKGYSKEILTPEFGCGLDGLLKSREKDLYGIVNGVDYSIWNPAVDQFIAKKFNEKDLKGKIECKKDLAESFEIKYNAKRPIIAMITRLAEQKGIDLVVNIMKDLLKDSDFVILGFGEEKYNKIFQEMAKKYKGKVGVSIKFDNALSHKMEAGSDMFLMPSRYEPCGLNQMYSLKYATVPVVRAVGGLDDTIHNFNPATKKGNGFKFKDATNKAFLGAIKKAVAAFKDKKLWDELLKNCVSCDFSWESSAEQYLKLYKNL
ncbi:MAG: glycogen synthase GlgA [Candidatus Omnitrophica bacterium CG22_combo_CG10-13_8_21_14_all_43_16]|nr:MAG: glycogen synthase GlgA [Candidatus Omnitrophica bacterium CG22_combo_CG10-13_8_21_14_all_43_16]